ncbi:hypothetical protein [Sphingomonas sp. 28-63-12]|uniref:hypothetical protein n=1 Tax=Sphingomonas sp. 28-63-12 TaxID=1970434 RepID=UPI0035A8B9A2
MFYIHLFRVKCESLPQGDFLRASRDSVEVISKSIESKPTAEVGRRSEWHIGNVERVDGGGIAFAMGRTQAVTSPKFDSVSHDFVEEEAMKAPFTIGVFDVETQACGIIRKTGVSQNSSEVARNLEVLLNAARFARESNSRIIVEPIPDPVGFIDAIRRAKAVTRFIFTVSRPNPHDVNRLIQRPAEEFTEAAEGTRTRVEVEGENLNKDLIEEVAHATAAVGEIAAANIIPEGGGRTKRVYLSGNAVVEPVETNEKTSVFAAILDRTRAAYARVRNSARP